MECPECARLGEQRELLEAHYAKALAVFSASVTGGYVGDFLETRKAAEQAKIDLESAQAEMMRHQQESHAP